MKAVAGFLFGLGVFACLGLSGWGQDKNDDKKETKKEDKKPAAPVEAPKLDGQYKLVSGKINNTDLAAEPKTYEYTFTADKMTIKGEKLKFVIGYKLDLRSGPIKIDMEILEGPEGTKGSKAGGIIEVKGDVVKLAYTMEKEKNNDMTWKRPQNFEGKDGNAFEFKKVK